MANVQNSFVTLSRNAQVHATLYALNALNWIALDATILLVNRSTTIRTANRWQIWFSCGIALFSCGIALLWTVAFKPRGAIIERPTSDCSAIRAELASFYRLFWIISKTPFESAWREQRHPARTNLGGHL